mmetsp:Transcript_6696/g.19792  ORF Transcript_6696/g.19792 Transcript_6696/m.19792 type:complete len:217 (+) Transcript_6696:74-724(+)
MMMRMTRTSTVGETVISSFNNQIAKTPNPPPPRHGSSFSKFSHSCAMRGLSCLRHPLIILRTLSGLSPTSLDTSAMVRGPEKPWGNVRSSMRPYLSSRRSTSWGVRYRRRVSTRLSRENRRRSSLRPSSSVRLSTRSYIVSFLLASFLFGLSVFCIVASREWHSWAMAFRHLFTWATLRSDAWASSSSVGRRPNSVRSSFSTLRMRLCVSWSRWGT